MGVITFNGRVSTDYGIHVEKPPKYNIAEENYEAISIPGRNGDLFYSNSKTYKNVPREYDVSFYNKDGNMEKIANKLYEFLHGADGYARLEDTYDSDVFRLAYYTQKTDLENILFKAGRGKISFSCKPQRFLKSGEESWLIYSDQFEVPEHTEPNNWDYPLFYDYSVHKIFDMNDAARGQLIEIPNPTGNIAYPLIRILVSVQQPGETGWVSIGQYRISYTLPNPRPIYLDIDCETMSVTCAGTFYNSCVTFNTTDNIILPPYSDSAVDMVSDEIAMRVVPRWWIL